MKLTITTAIIVCLSFSASAGENDSLEISFFPKDKVKTNLNAKVDSTLSAIDSTDSAVILIDSIAVVETQGSELVICKENDNFFSDTITYFELGKVPVNKELFEYHCSLMDFKVPMEYNQLVKTQIDYFGTRWQSKLKEMVSKSQHFFPLYEEILTEYELPLEIKYLSIIESGLNPHARSKCGAVGAWQFMPATARIFDLKMDYNVDERRSLDKSTKAACIYLKQMFNQYDDWLVALASYNCGPGNVRKAMRLSGSNNFWGIYEYLPRETQNYVPKFIAMTYLMNFYDEYGIVPSSIEDSLYSSKQVYCKNGYDFEIIAEQLGISNDQLLSFNPELKRSIIPYKGEGYLLNVPQNISHLYYENEEDIESLSLVRVEEKRIAEANRPKVTYHYVQKGESLILIARRRGVTVSQLRMWNGIKGSTIYPKQKLRIYR